MANFKLYAALALGFMSAPAVAVSYEGELHGHMFYGQVNYDGSFDVDNPSNDYLAYSFIDRPVSIYFNVQEIQDEFTLQNYWSGSASFDIAMPQNTDPRIISSSWVDGDPNSCHGGSTSFERYGNSVTIALFGDPGSCNNNYSSIDIFIDSISQEISQLSGQGSLNYGFGWGHHLRGSGAFVITSGRVTATGVSAVPEPASWAMMLIGFGAVGAVVRRRRGTVAGQAREPLALA